LVIDIDAATSHVGEMSLDPSIARQDAMAAPDCLRQEGKAVVANVAVLATANRTIGRAKMPANQENSPSNTRHDSNSVLDPKMSRITSRPKHADRRRAASPSLRTALIGGGPSDAPERERPSRISASCEKPSGFYLSHFWGALQPKGAGKKGRKGRNPKNPDRMGIR
jgi:hypothetical protein